ncbi:conserved hypothetical protein [Rhodococcus sp. RD6.2]|uniref:hypothetical protein n=1 Tax=Rhodococcus sp. RD6.2 TaxID=260936 RepID=UPI00063B97DE|nr:hypothetical protein [Rhodococcus sp. RD6.2]CRK52665.1 conserved hypothetical protein [Rhodococcus sp. RD6.2]
MPPHRRSSNTPQPKGRRPKIAGRQSPRSEAPAPDEVEQTSLPATGTPDSSPAAAVASEPPVEVTAPTDRAVDTEATAVEPDTVEMGGSDGVEAQDTPESTPEGSSEPQTTPRPVNRTSSLRPRAQADDGPGGPRDASSTVAGSPADDEAVRAGWRRVAVLTAIAVGLGVFAAVAAVRPGAQVTNRAWVDQAETMEVTAAARDAIQTLYTYGWETVEEDFDNARAVLTDSMRTQFDQTAQVTQDAVTQTKTQTNAQVTDIGVKLLDGDRAELVASMNVSASNDGVEQGSAAGPLSVTMTRVGDTWLLSEIRDR